MFWRYSEKIYYPKNVTHSLLVILEFNINKFFDTYIENRMIKMKNKKRLKTS